MISDKGDDVHVVNLYFLMLRCLVKCLDSGIKVLFPANFVDIVYTREVTGYVLRGIAVEIGLRKVLVYANVTVDTTQNADVVRKVIDEIPHVDLPTPNGSILGIRGFWPEESDKAMVSNTRRIFPGLVVCGIAANTVFGSPKPFNDLTSIILSAKKASYVVKSELRK